MLESEFVQIQSICDLLTACGAISNDDASLLNSKAAQQRITVGECIVNEQAATEDLVRSAILCHLMMTKRVLPYSTAIKALNISKTRNFSIEDAFDCLAYNRAYYEQTAAISNLMLRAGLISVSVRDVAYDICSAGELPILPVIVERNELSDTVADLVLSVHERVNKGEIDHDEAVALLTNSSEPNPPKKSVYERKPKRLRLGELLIAANVISSIQLISAVERSRVAKLPFGQYLVSDRIISESFLDFAVKLQSELDEGFMTPYDALVVLMTFAGENSAGKLEVENA